MGFKANTLQVYGLVASCMPDGITSRAIRDELVDLSRQTVCNKLTNLSEHGYLACTRRGRQSVWRTTDKALPAPQPRKTRRAQAPAPAPAPQPDRDCTDHLFTRSPPPPCPPPGVPNSVFALACTLA